MMAKKQNRPQDKIMRRLHKKPPRQWYETRREQGPEVADDQRVAIGLEILRRNNGKEWGKRKR